jgi:crotonobetainyl-CoA:carnitine CoA-transferase CaiB-like acyl-CoA transferase
MLSTVAHTLSDDVVEYDDQCPAAPAPDLGLHGFGALYRFYQAAEGWICLAAPQPGEWATLAAALAEFADLSSDDRFTSESARRDNGVQLAEVLAGIFRTRTATEWEQRLTAVDIGCVEVTEALPEAFLQSEAFGRASDLLVGVIHPTFDKHPRLAPLVTFSRSAVTPQGGCLLGQHTDAVLRELGYTEAQICDLRSSSIVGG